MLTLTGLFELQNKNSEATLVTHDLIRTQDFSSLTAKIYLIKEYKVDNR
jgi:hypothetical protein